MINKPSWMAVVFEVVKSKTDKKIDLSSTGDMALIRDKAKQMNKKSVGKTLERTLSVDFYRYCSAKGANVSQPLMIDIFDKEPNKEIFILKKEYKNTMLDLTSLIAESKKSGEKNTTTEFSDVEKNQIKEEIVRYKINSEILPKNERYSYVRQRVGQSIFRDNLYNHWQGCSVTGYKDKKMLIASHIIPYRDTNDESAYDLHNGLLLTPNLDKAFDRGYISFDDDGKIIISKDFKKYEQFGITLGMKLIEISDEQRRYLKCHREETLI